MSSEERAAALDMESDDRLGRRVELIISRVLRTGVMASLVLIVVGTLLTFLHHPGYASSPSDLARLTQPGAAVPHTLRGVATGVLALRGQSIVAAGLLLLMLTPVIRVAVSIVAFMVQRDRVYVAITSVVLLLLLLSFALGRSAV
ncbi:MAG TPA: DUF1634 domain-containing protein [Gemmatimonadales bacterium]|jgi:uncharacterized membrane protein|nr:DUF1634 domain-containing protein [Gemmatimonadales bacterium]